MKLDPPPAGEGFQLEIPEFDVPAGTEVQDCYFLAVPATESYVTRIVIAQNTGTHHMNAMRLGTRRNLWGEAGDVVRGGECWKPPNWADWNFFANSQSSNPGATSNDWTLPDKTFLKFGANEVIMLQTHYVNSSVQKTPGKGKVFMNFYTTPKETATANAFQELAMFFTVNNAIHACPGDTAVNFNKQCRFASAPVTVTAVNSHFHSHGVNFDVAALDSSSTKQGAPFYQNTSWDSPLFKTGMNIPIETGGGLEFNCSYTVTADDCGDPADSCCFSFGSHNQSQEHCNLFVYYYPRLPDPVAGNDGNPCL